MSGNTDQSLFNDDELVPPDWLNSEFIEGVLKSDEMETVLKVIDLTFSPASAKGDHYASIMFRAKVKYYNRKGDFERSLIIKTMPEAEGHKKELIGGSPIFETETGLYTKVLPEFERILRQAGDSTKLYVNCIYHSLAPHQVLIFEDLVEMDYFVLRDRDAALDEIHPVYFKLAKWHAASLKVQEEQPDFLEPYTYGLLEMPHILTEPFMKTGMHFFVELLKMEPELKKYKSYFESIKGDFLERLVREWKEFRNNPKVDQYRVLCHGDLHLRNIMFKYKTPGFFEDCMLLDFQISHLFPLTIDLVYSIYMLMEAEHRWKHCDDLINYYFIVLEDVLKKIGYKGEMPKQSGIWERLHQHKYFEFFLISTFLPLMWALRDKSVDFGDLLQNEEKRRSCSFAEGYIKDVKIMLARLDKLGLLQD
ncbi:uncharacterized protein LOC108143886 isoform X1 [Drosophila elegans]|uniref:uncharacterized protein LOC108143886 isoform X1 n=2 Tax=Drosophila elegans TaxID=30023 RepID=UPI0007E788C1|nr:uncharacterized protein LOC108143886 isoform X1 [Drosophila elegans]